MTKTAYINTRVAPELKKDAETVFSQLGLSMSDAVSLFLTQSVLNRGLPFPVRIPNDELAASLRASENGDDETKTYQDAKSMMDDLWAD